MKKIKIMLFSFALLSIVAGLLAFKAKFEVPYCTTLPVGTSCPAELPCTNFALSVSDPGGCSFYCTTTPVGNSCPNSCTTEPSIKLLPD